MDALKITVNRAEYEELISAMEFTMDNIAEAEEILRPLQERLFSQFGKPGWWKDTERSKLQSPGEQGPFLKVRKIREGWPEAINRAIEAEKLLASHAPDGYNVSNLQYEKLREENDLQRQSIQDLSLQVATYQRVLNDIYPDIAGRVIQLQRAGEEKAVTEWKEIARKIYTVIKDKSGQSLS
jgi:hypothetical protein